MSSTEQSDHEQEYQKAMAEARLHLGNAQRIIAEREVPNAYQVPGFWAGGPTEVNPLAGVNPTQSSAEQGAQDSGFWRWHNAQRGHGSHCEGYCDDVWRVVARLTAENQALREQLAIRGPYCVLHGEHQPCSQHRWIPDQSRQQAGQQP
jgi:hypothetical protein